MTGEMYVVLPSSTGGRPELPTVYGPADRGHRYVRRLQAGETFVLLSPRLGGDPWVATALLTRDGSVLSVFTDADAVERVDQE